MAKLFDEIFTDVGSGDIELVVLEDAQELPPEGAQDSLAEERRVVLQLRCHSLIITQHPYFYKMLSTAIPLRESISREVCICEPPNEFVELIRFIYTGQVDISRQNVSTLLTLADKYCIDEVVDLCLKYIKDNFDADTFYTFYNFTTLNSAYQDKLRDQLMSALMRRRHLCAITEDARWGHLPVELVESILAQDDLPIASEAEVFTLMAQWLVSNRCGRLEVYRLLGAFRKCENIWVRVSDVDSLMQALGHDIFSSRTPRNGSSVWDPSFAVHRHEAAGPTPVGAVATDTFWPEERGCTRHQLGPKDFLQQEPGWMYPGVHRCRVSVACTSWSHRERRLMRSNPTQAAAFQKRAFECGPAKPTARERSPSPPVAFQTRILARDTFDSFDIAPMSESSGHGVRNDKIDHELVEHQVICGISCGYQRHGLRFSQREGNAIYLVEDLNGNHSLNIGGTTSSVSFDLELTIGEASNCGISKCRFALQRNMNTLLEEWWDSSSQVPLRFYISSSYFDQNSCFTVCVRWLRPPVDHHQGRRYYVGQ